MRKKSDLPPRKNESEYLFKSKGVILELEPRRDAFEQTKKLGKLICERIATVKPYIEEAVDFMYEGENRSRLRTEVNIFLYDEKAESDRFDEKVWSRVGPEYSAKASKLLHKYRDPLSSHYIQLWFADGRGQKNIADPNKKRYLTISLFNGPYEVPIGHVYLTLKKYNVGT